MHHWLQWSTIGAEPWVVSVLRDGYRIPFRDLPSPLARSLVQFPTYRPDSERALPLLGEIETMMAKGVLETVSDPDPGFYSRLFLVEKSSGGWRPVIDLSPLNEFVRQTPFRMETLSPSCSQERRLPRLDRPQGRLLPDPGSPLLQEAPPFCFKRYGLPVQSPVFRVIDCPASVHKSFRGGLFLGTLPWSPHSAIPGRLADPVYLGGQDKATREPTPRTLPLPRHSHKQREVRPLPFQVRRIPRHDHRHSISPSVPR